MKTASVSDIATALTSHIVPASKEGDTKLEEAKKSHPSNGRRKSAKRKVHVKLDPCPFCTFQARSRVAKIAHDTQCILNPDRKIQGILIPCSKCGVEIATRAHKNHEKYCDGVAEHTQARIAIKEDLQRRKAIARRDGVPFVDRYGNVHTKSIENVKELPVVSTTLAPKDSVAPTTSSDLDAFISIMEERLKDSNVTFAQFNEWKSLTIKVWG